MPRPLMFTIALTMATGAAHASSDEAWEAFRAEVEQACTALAEVPEGGELTVEVNPFGSESYGVALVSVTVPGMEDDAPAAAADRMVCIFDKQTKAAEITGPFTPVDPA